MHLKMQTNIRKTPFLLLISLLTLLSLVFGDTSSYVDKTKVSCFYAAVEKQMLNDSIGSLKGKTVMCQRLKYSHFTHEVCLNMS